MNLDDFKKGWIRYCTLGTLEKCESFSETLGFIYVEHIRQNGGYNTAVRDSQNLDSEDFNKAFLIFLKQANPKDLSPKTWKSIINYLEKHGYKK